MGMWWSIWSIHINPPIYGHVNKESGTRDGVFTCFHMVQAQAGNTMRNEWMEATSSGEVLHVQQDEHLIFIVPLLMFTIVSPTESNAVPSGWVKKKDFQRRGKLWISAEFLYNCPLETSHIAVYCSSNPHLRLNTTIKILEPQADSYLG